MLLDKIRKPGHTTQRLTLLEYIKHLGMPTVVNELWKPNDRLKDVIKDMPADEGKAMEMVTHTFSAIGLYIQYEAALATACGAATPTAPPPTPFTYADRAFNELP